MTSAAAPVTDRADVRTLVSGGIKLGFFTAVAVVVFAFTSRSLSGVTETIVQSGIVLAAGVVLSVLPAIWVRPSGADGIAWAALLGLLGALTFTVVDTAILRPLGVYYWRWDAIGGGSGFWYIPVWWMGSASIAWLGAWAVARDPSGAPVAATVRHGARTVLVALVVFGAITVSGAAPPTAAVVALAFAIALALSVPLATMFPRR
jgi:hypothetical protein